MAEQEKVAMPVPKPGVINRGDAQFNAHRRMERMKKYFAEQPRETIRIRKDDGDQTVRINGYGFRIQAGTPVKVPVDVAEQLRNAEII